MSSRDASFHPILHLRSYFRRPLMLIGSLRYSLRHMFAFGPLFLAPSSRCASFSFSAQPFSHALFLSLAPESQSWTGIASEAVDFLVPLAHHLPQLGLTGIVDFVHGYILSSPSSRGWLMVFRDRYATAAKKRTKQLRIW